MSLTIYVHMITGEKLITVPIYGYCISIHECQ